MLEQNWLSTDHIKVMERDFDELRIAPRPVGMARDYFWGLLYLFFFSFSLSMPWYRWEVFILLWAALVYVLSLWACSVPDRIARIAYTSGSYTAYKAYTVKSYTDWGGCSVWGPYKPYRDSLYGSIRLLTSTACYTLLVLPILPTLASQSRIQQK